MTDRSSADLFNQVSDDRCNSHCPFPLMHSRATQNMEGEVSYLLAFHCGGDRKSGVCVRRLSDPFTQARFFALMMWSAVNLPAWQSTAGVYVHECNRWPWLPGVSKTEPAAASQLRRDRIPGAGVQRDALLMWGERKRHTIQRVLSGRLGSCFRLE